MDLNSCFGSLNKNNNDVTRTKNDQPRGRKKLFEIFPFIFFCWIASMLSAMERRAIGGLPPKIYEGNNISFSRIFFRDYFLQIISLVALIEGPEEGIFLDKPYQTLH